MAKYDFVIVGAGFAGASCARLLTNKGYKCLIIEERPFVGGNCVTDSHNEIEIHFYGPHILHTSNEEVWEFLKSYDSIIDYKYSVIAWNNSRTYKLPFGMDMLASMYDIAWPYDATKELENDIEDNKDKSFIEGYCLSKYGRKVYETVIKNYYEKIYGMPCSEISTKSFIDMWNDNLIYRNSYYDDIYQGMPENGYVNLIENIIGNDIDILLNTNFLASKEKFMKLGEKIIYTGEIDKFFNYCMGAMDWRTIKFQLDDESEKTNNLCGCPIVHFTDNKTNWYRVTEFKWLTPWRAGNKVFDEHTILSYEISKKWEKGDETFYPVFNERSLNLHQRYLIKLKEQYPRVIPFGRRAFFNNLTICETIQLAIEFTNQIPDKEEK